MEQQQHILFSLSCPPKQGPGSPIIVDRHLKRLSSDWKISVVAPEQSFTGINFPDSWQAIPMPQRQWWWPPYRPQIPVLLETRFWCWQQECEQVLQGERPTAILTVLQDIYAVFAAHLSRVWQVPLYVILHDREELWKKSEAEYDWTVKNWLNVLNQATQVWSVSEELGNVYQINDPTKISTLIPIPEGRNQNFVDWKEEFQNSPVVAYAGSIYPSQVSHFETIASTLQKINGKLLLVTPQNPGVSQLLNSYPNVERYEPFAKNVDVINFLAEKASCILVPYPLNLTEHPWAATCFPSKLVEFSHLGLPILILAPLNTALGSWAKSYDWYSYLMQMDSERLLQILAQMTDKEKWMQMAGQSQAVARTEFNPELIQAQFLSELTTTKK